MAFPSRVSGLCLPLFFPSPCPSLGNCDFFSSASPVVYPAGGCDVRDAQQQKITTSPSATRWPLARALFIYLFRDAGGGGRQPKGTTSRCRSLSGGRGGPQGCAWRGLGPARGRGGLGGVSRLQHWRGSGRSPKRRNLLLFIVWQLHAVLAARPSPASACVCARVCAGECVSGGRARAGVSARGERPPKTP